MSLANSQYTNLTIVLLSLINNKVANYGYTISNWINYSGLDCQHQQVYRQLRLLENNGYVTTSLEVLEGKPDRKIYQISALGKKTLNQLELDTKSKITPFDIACTLRKPTYIKQANAWLRSQISELNLLESQNKISSRDMIHARKQVLGTQLDILKELAA